MSENTQEKRKKSYRFQRFICVGYVMSEPELKVMKPFKEGEDGLPYCTFMASTGSPYGENSDAVFSVMLKGKNAETFCKEPRKGKEYLFDLQLRTYNKDPLPGQKYGERVTSFVGSFNYCGPKDTTTPARQETPPAKQPPVDKKQEQEEEIPF